MYALLGELRSHEKWDESQIAAYQLQSIRQVVERARSTVPFYAGYPQVDLRSLEDLACFPVIDRETVRQDPDRLVSSSIPSHQLIRVGTTGTTGANLKVAYTAHVARQGWAFRMRQWAWAGVQPRQSRVTLFGSRIVPPTRQRLPFWTYNAFERQALMSIFHLSEQTAPHYIAFLRKHQGELLEGFPSVLGILADFILDRGETVPMRVVFTDGEPLYGFLREKIEKAFQTRVFDSYGMTESCGLVQECEQRRMHLIPEYGYLEILDKDDHRQKPGDEGDLVWTGFVNTAMPLIRYRIGDRGCWQGGGSCPCGRAFPLVRPTITRESDLLRCPDGRIFSPRAINQILKGASSFRYCQFVQDQPAHVLVRAVAAGGAALEELMRVRVDLQRLLGKGMQVTGQLAAGPIVRHGGKIPLIIREAEL
jgi:phenylacetate-CoA ligase